MESKVVAFTLGFGLILTWMSGVICTCGLLGFTPGLPENALLQNTSHFSEEIHRFEDSSFHNCVQLCKATYGCTCINYERLNHTCVLYSTSGTPTFETTADDWLYVKMADTTYPSVPSMCDPTTCIDRQVCRTFQGADLCLNLPD